MLDPLLGINTVRIKHFPELNCVYLYFCDSFASLMDISALHSVQFMLLSGRRHPLPAFLCLTWMLLLMKINSICLPCNCCLTVIQSVQSFRFTYMGHTISPRLHMILFNSGMILSSRDFKYIISFYGLMCKASNSNVISEAVWNSMQHSWAFFVVWIKFLVCLY